MMKRAIAVEREIFLKDFILNPSKIGSVTPSSSYLTKKLLGSLPWARLHTIVELGAGTGVFTKYITDHREPFSSFLIVEQDTMMHLNLMQNFPKALFGSRAESLPFLMKYYNLPKADCIVSGLPFAVIPKQERLKILAGIDTMLADDGIFVAFQYSLQMYGTFRRMFRKADIGFTPFNIPPAFTYTCRK